MNRDQYIEAFRELEPDAHVIVKGNRWEDVEIPGYVKPEKETLAGVYLDMCRDRAVDTLLANYMIICTETDSEEMMYSKRSNLGILSDDDQAQYDMAMERYRQATVTYRQRKQQITDAQSIAELEAIPCTVE